MNIIVEKALLIAFVFTALFLTGCSTVPLGKVNGDKLCTGTKRPYEVKGTWYTPQEHYDYEEEGIASWYGPQFHGRPKSCGEVFNMHGISAAHKTLPIPSVVRVTNVRSGTSVKLLVDDRGPFVGDRIIDLSKGAATYLGIHNQGLGKVRVECLPEESKAFAKFVAQYGRYGRDPSGRPWEAIFRERFDNGGCVPSVKLLPLSAPKHTPKNLLWPKKDFSRKTVRYRRPLVKSIALSKRPYGKPRIRKRQSHIDRLTEVQAY